MATLNAHGSFYRIQDNITRVQQDLGNNMQRLSSGLKNIAAGSRPGDVAIVKSMEAGIATLEYGKANAEAGVAALEMAVSDLSRLSDIIARMYEINQIGGNIFTTDDDKAMLILEHTDLKEEFALIAVEMKYRGKDLDTSKEYQVKNVAYHISKSIAAKGIRKTKLFSPFKDPSNGVQATVNRALPKAYGRMSSLYGTALESSVLEMLEIFD